MEFNKVIAGAFFYVGKYRQELSKALAIPFVIYLAIDASSYIALHPVVSWLLSVLGFAIQAIIAITTHRVVLLGPNSVPVWGISTWTMRETYFVLHVIGLSLLAIPLSILGFMPVIGVLSALLLFCWLFGRLSLVFPGIAVDKGVTFKHSWELTRDHQLLMFLVVIIFPILMAIPTIIISLVPYTFLLNSLVSTIAIVFQVAALSMAYQLVTENFTEEG